MIERIRGREGWKERNNKERKMERDRIRGRERE
jgi:hypothetical protein